MPSSNQTEGGAPSLSTPLTLPNGLTLPNRLVKAAMAENLASPSNGLPTDPRLLSAYRAWSTGNWGMILTGNVQVDSRYLGSPQDIFIDAPSLSSNPELRSKVLSAFKAYADACRPPVSPNSNDPRGAIIVQINHPGRQSPLGAGTRPFLSKNLAPSAIPLTLGGSGTSSPLSYLLTNLLFGTPKELTLAEISDITSRFAQTSLLLAQAGFDGVEIHAAHGYLLSQFLSPRSNTRNDQYGGSATNRARIVVEIIHATRDLLNKEGGPDGKYDKFAVGIKINSADSQADGEDGLQECIEQLKLVIAAGVDFVEVSGGSYDDPRMFLGTSSSSTTGSSTTKKEESTPAKSERTQAREAFFHTFAQAIRSSLSQEGQRKVPLVLTGGFRTRRGMNNALETSDCDLVGIGRPAVINPHLPANILLNGEVQDDEAIAYAKRVPLPGLVGRIARWILPVVIGAGYETAWYGAQIGKMGELLAGKD